MSNGSMADITVRIEGLRKEYAGIVAVDGLDLSIPRGCIYGLIGPNGSGKTTTIKILMGLVRADSGSSWLLGDKVSPRSKPTRVSYMPQELALYPDLSVHENLELFADLYGVSKEDFMKREGKLLEVVELEDRRDSLVGELSGGMQHRTSLACALVNDPELVFLDEPTVGVDPELRAGFWAHFDLLKGAGKTIVLTTHYMDEASRCDIVGMMHKGRLIGEGMPQDLMHATCCENLEDVFMEFIRRQKK